MSIAYTILKRSVARIYDAFVHTSPVLDTATYFPGASAFVSNWKVLRDEALLLTDDLRSIPQFHELMSVQSRLSPDQKEWRIFVLRAYGLDIEANMGRCPRLAELVAANPDIQSATLSFLAPGKHVPTHKGPFRGITRFYMGLSVPSQEDGRPGVTLTIDGNDHLLGDGDALLWDDTFDHSVRNDTHQWRIALLLDIYRSNMPPPLRGLTNTIIGLTRFSIKRRRVFPDAFA